MCHCIYSESSFICSHRISNIVLYVASVSAATFLVKEILWSDTLTSAYNFTLRLDRYVFTLRDAYVV